MKHILSTSLALIVSLALFSGCSPQVPSGESASASNGADNRLKIVSTIFPGYDFARQIAGENAEVTMLLPPGSESHSFEPTPQDFITLQNCDVFLYVGGDSDAWMKGILDSVDTSHMTILSMMDIVDVVEEEIKEGMEHSHDHEGHDEDHHDEDHHDEEHHGEEHHDEDHHDEEHHGEEHHDEDHHGEEHHDEEHHDEDHHDEDHHDEDHHDEDHHHEYDEHVWTSPSNAKRITQAISDVLCELDEKHAPIFRENTDNYLAKLDALDASFRHAVEQGKRKTLIFGDRFPFRYFVDAYGLDYYAAFPGCSAETEANAKTVAFLVDKVKTESIPVVFYIELSNEKMADTISESTGAKKLLFHSCHNLTKDEMKQGVTYLELMTQNAERLKEALN